MEELNLVIRDPVLGTRLERPKTLPASESFRVMSEFDAERGEVFLAEAAVHVEGRTEQLALPHVFSALGHDPDRSGTTLVEWGGQDRKSDEEGTSVARRGRPGGREVL